MMRHNFSVSRTTSAVPRLGFRAHRAVWKSAAFAPPVNNTTHLTYDATSYKVDQIEKQFLLEHDHPQKERLLREIDAAIQWDRRNGENGD